MDIVELKKRIEDNTLNNKVLILKYSDNTFLCKHYIKHIAQNKGKEILYISSLSEIEEDSNFFEMESPFIRVLEKDNLEESIDNSLKDLIIICKNVPKDLKIDYTDMTKLINWQIEDFVKYRLPGLKDNQVQWLCENCKYDIYRLDNECKKLENFQPILQEALFKEQVEDNSYCDLNAETIFNLKDAIFKKEANSVKNILANREYIDIEPAGLVSLLLKDFYKLLVVSNSYSWNEGMSSIISEKQYRFFKAVYCKLYGLTELINIYELLTSIDYKLKSGQLDYDKIVDYLIIKIFGV